MKFRHEEKHIINKMDMLNVRQRLSAVAKPDANGTNGKYKIRSLYFDNIQDKALREKIDGLNNREKFRIRYYNNDPSIIRLEKKSKINGLTNKQSVIISREMTESIINGDYEELKNSASHLENEFYTKIICQGLRPKAIIDYYREAYVFKAGNVRVTLDYDIRSSMDVRDFFNPECVTIPVTDNGIILEVKWDEFLPDVIRSAVQLNNRRATAFSKYAMGRIYG